MYRSNRWLKARLRELLGASEYEPLLHWIEAARQQRPVLFVGAGFSRTARAKATSPGKRMLSWRELTELLKDGLGQSADGDDFLWVAEKFKCLHGGFALHTKILEAVPDAHVEPGPEHLSLHHVEWHAILTLNYDTLLERAFQATSPRTVIPVVEEEHAARITRRSSLPVIHLHGHIEHPSSIVLTLEDFRKYSRDRAVFLTIARQLLLQHPVLFLGFGANDPNFVAWSGWIRDRVGDQSPPWVRLQIDESRALDPGMNAYWSPRLRSVLYKKPDFAELLKVLGQAIEPLQLDDDSFLDYIDELVGLTRKIKKGDTAFFVATVEEIANALEKKSPALHRIDYIQRRRRVARLLHAGLEQSGADQQTLDVLIGQNKEQASQWQKAGVATPQSPETLPTMDEQKLGIRTKMGDAFLPWLISAARLSGRYIGISDKSETRLDIVEEYRLLRSPRADASPSGDALLQLGLLTLPYELERLGATADEAAALDWLAIPSADVLDVANREALDDTLHRRKLRWGGIPNPQIDQESDSAQAARQCGYLAAMQGGFVEALDFYERAALLSSANDEPIAVRYMTEKSASDLLYACEMVRALPRDGGKRRAAANGRLKALEREAGELQLDLTLADLEHARNRANQLRKDLDGSLINEPDRVLLRTRSEALEPVLDFHEEHWFSPLLCAHIASRLGVARWEANDCVSAAALLAQYDCGEELAARMHTYVEAPRPRPVAPEVMNELRRAPRWPHERYARLLGLIEASSELLLTARDELLQFAFESYEALSKQQHLLTHIPSTPASPAVSLGVAIGCFSPWPVFKDWLQKVQRTAGEDVSQMADARWLQLPIAGWIKSGELGAEDADAFFGFLLQIAGWSRSRLTEEQVLDLIQQLILNLDIRPHPEGNCVGALRSMLANRGPEDDSEEWLRTECYIALEVLSGGNLHELRAARASELKRLIQAAVVLGNWPNPFVVRAWLACIEAWSPEDGILARNLLAIQPAEATEGFRSAHADGIRQLDARGRLLMIARLAPESDSERNNWQREVERIAKTVPEALSDILLKRPIGSLDVAIREALATSVSEAFNAPIPARERTYGQYIALACVARAISNSGARELPHGWLLSACFLTTAPNPDLAAYACTVLGACVARNNAEWGLEHLELFADIRRALLRAASDARAIVAAAARQSLTNASTTNAAVHAQIAGHNDVRARLAAMRLDDRLAVAVAVEPWNQA